MRRADSLTMAVEVVELRDESRTRVAGLERSDNGVACAATPSLCFHLRQGHGGLIASAAKPAPALVSRIPLERRLVWFWLGLGLVGVAAAAERPFANPFGMHLRPAPATVAAAWAPAIVREAPTNEMVLVRRANGDLELYGIAKPASDAVTVLRSRDGGLTWSAPENAFALPGRAYYAVQVLEAADGALHAVVHLLGEGPGGYRGRLYEVYHARRERGAAAWSAPRRVVPGYVGSIRGFIQLRRGRLVLAVARAIPEREQPPATGPDRGWNDTFVYTSDDAGDTWSQSPDVLSLALPGPNVTRYGAIEPALLELRDGRTWMLVRDRGGRLWNSHSPDGVRWDALERTPFISSDSPAGLLRLRDGRIVLFTNACQYWSDPRSYAMGGREVLHAAASADEGRTWRGFREVLHETVAVTRGDRGTAYPSAVENAAGRVVLVSGQGEGKRAIVMFDPRWLEERAVRCDFARGPEDWTQYGGGGLARETVADGTAVLALAAPAGAAGGASWNFPAADSGEVALRMRLSPGGDGLRLCLNDHFTRVDDLRAAGQAVVEVAPVLAAAAGDAAGAWHDLRLTWSGAARGGDWMLAVDGREAARGAVRRPAPLGVNYLRVEFRGPAAGAGLRLGAAAMRATP